LCEQILRDAKLKTGNRGQKTELTVRSPFRRQRSALDCNGVYEGGGGKEDIATN